MLVPEPNEEGQQFSLEPVFAHPATLEGQKHQRKPGRPNTCIAAQSVYASHQCTVVLPLHALEPKELVVQICHQISQCDVWLKQIWLLSSEDRIVPALWTWVQQYVKGV